MFSSGRLLRMLSFLPACGNCFIDWRNELWLSVASVWEIFTKVQIGKLPLPSPAGNYLRRQLAMNNIRVLQIGLNHVMRLEDMPLHHRDPFDRLLVAQSQEEQLPIVSADPLIRKYPVTVVW